MRYAFTRFMKNTPLLLALFVAGTAIRFWDQGQCTRVCRVANGDGPVLVRGQQGKGMGEVPEGSWFAPAEV